MTGRRPDNRHELGHDRSTQLGLTRAATAFALLGLAGPLAGGCVTEPSASGPVRDGLPNAEDSTGSQAGAVAGPGGVDAPAPPGGETAPDPAAEAAVDPPNGETGLEPQVPGDSEPEPSADPDPVEAPTAPEEPAAQPASDDPCTPNPCVTPPVDLCSGDLALSHSPKGTCTAVEGVASCAYPATVTDCAAVGTGCTAGACDDPPPPPAVGEVLVTEVSAGTDSGSGAWIEFTNISADGSDRDLAGCALQTAEGATVALVAAALVVGGGTLVLADSHAMASFGDGIDAALVDLAGLELSLATGLALMCGTDTVDSAVFPGTAALGAGGHVALDPTATTPGGNDDPGAWCEPPAGPSPGSANTTCDEGVDWCALWYPAYATVPLGGGEDFFVHVFESGVTDTTLNAPDLSAMLEVEVGWGPKAADPAVDPDAFTWVGAGVDLEPPVFVSPNHDRYAATVPFDEPGEFRVYARVSTSGGADGTWSLCDLDGTDNGVSPETAGNVVVD